MTIFLVHFRIHHKKFFVKILILIRLCLPSWKKKLIKKRLFRGSFFSLLYSGGEFIYKVTNIININKKYNILVSELEERIQNRTQPTTITKKK